MSFLQQALAVAAKDLRIELRGRYAAGVVLPFACTQLIAFGLSLGPGRTLLQATAPALLWLAVLFAAVLAFRGAYEAEGEDGALEGLLLASVDKAAVFVGKAAAVVVQLLALEVVVVMLTAVLFGVVSAGGAVGLAAALELVAAMTLGTVGLAALGSLFGVLTEAARAREAVFPLLILPLTTPVLVAGVRATALVQAGHPEDAASWLGLLLVFDVVFLSAGALLFGHLLED
ncbi:MAG TPA: heme exporter protein CcmB [Candidatus Dormibacteraeota bacterium]|nr:heme exporter protein CcmB [Candidatus Dormibacteraeota bacterium]